MRFRWRRRVETVYGHSLPAARITYRAVGLGVLWVGAPILGGGVVLDVLVWVAAKTMFDACVGLWCWLGG